MKKAKKGGRSIPVPFLTLGARFGWSKPRPAALPPGKKFCTHCRVGWVGPRVGLDVRGKFHPLRNSAPGPSSPQLIAIPYAEGQISPFNLYACLNGSQLPTEPSKSQWLVLPGLRPKRSAKCVYECKVTQHSSAFELWAARCGTTGISLAAKRKRILKYRHGNTTMTYLLYC